MFRLTKTAQIIDRIIKTTPPFIYILLSLIIFIIIFFNYKIFVPKYFLIEDKNLYKHSKYLYNFIFNHSSDNEFKNVEKSQ